MGDHDRDRRRRDDAPAARPAAPEPASVSGLPVSAGNRAVEAAALQRLPGRTTPPGGPPPAAAPAVGATTGLPASAWEDFEDRRDRRNVDDTDAPPIGPYRGEMGGPQTQSDGSVEFEADARAEVAQADMFVVRMGGRSGSWATYPHPTLEAAMEEARDMARRYAIARQDEAAHGFRPGGDDPLHDLALPTQWSDSEQHDNVYRNAPYTDVGVFRLPAGTPYIASQVAPQPEGEDLAAGIAPRMRRGGAMQIQLTSWEVLQPETTVPVPTDIPAPDVAATSHTVTDQEMSVGGRSTSGTVIRTELATGEVITDTDTTERTRGVPTRRVRANETSQVDPIALNSAARTALEQRIALDERVIAAFEQDEDPSEQQRSSLAALRAGLARRRAAMQQLEGNAEPTRVRAIIAREALDVGDEPRRVTRGDRTETTLGAEGVTRRRATTRSGADAVLEDESSTTVGLGGVSTRQTDRLTTTDEARATRRVTEQSRSRSLTAGSISQTDTTEHSETDATGSRTSSSRSRTNSLRSGGGRLTLGTSSTRRDEMELSEGGVTATEVTNSASASVVHGSGGSGVAAEASTDRTQTARGVELGVRTGGNGSFTVNVVQLDTQPPTYRVTTTIHLGVSAGASARRARESNQPGGRASAGVSGQASGDIIYNRTLSAAEATRYLGNLDEVASGTTIDGRPEYGLLARARAIRLHGDADMGALVSADSARSMDDGESIDLDLGWGGDVTVGLGGQSSGGARTRASIGATGSVGHSGGRRIRVSRSGNHVDVTITVRSEDRRSGSLTGGYGVASATVGGSESAGESSAVTFRLDTTDQRTYDTQFGEVASLMTERSLIAYADANTGLVQSRTGGATRSSGETVGLDVGPVGVQIGQTGRRGSELTTGNGRITGTETGGQTTSGSLSVAGRTVANASTASDINATVSETETGEAELNVTLTQTDSESDVDQGAAELTRQFSGRRTEDNVADVLTSGPSDLLDRLLTTQSVRLTEYDLDQGDVDHVVQRARNERMWGRAISRHQLIRPWERLRSALVNPRPRREWLEADTTEDNRFAKKVAQAHALANFMEHNGERGGSEAIVWVLRYWGGGVGFDFRESTAEDIGTLREWPQSLAATRVRYNRLKGQVNGLNRRLDRMLPSAGDSGESNLERARSICGDLRSGLGRVEREITACNDYRQPRAQLEMSLEVSRMRRQVSQRLRRFEEMAAGRESTVRSGEEATAEQLVEQRTARHATLEEAEQACLPEEESTIDPAAVERVADSVRALQGQRRQYSRLLNQAYDLIPEPAHGGALHWWQGNAGEAVDKLIRAASMHEEWIRQIIELRDLYRAAGVPEREWQVKPNAAGRRRTLDPEIDRLVRYYVNIQEWRRDSWLGTPTWGYRETAAGWRAAANY